MAGNEYLYGGKTYSNDPKYNLMTEANKSSYIDRFIPKAMQISNMLSLA